MPEYPHPHKMKVAELRIAIAKLEAHEAIELAAADAAYDHALEAEHAAAAYEAKVQAEALAIHLPVHHA